ncbi:MAG TPA: methyltransferase domain-containing protein [Bacteroidia bacterium]|nr:methyltransferase domain-containing protein [Bacteroidia bacterium]
MNCCGAEEQQAKDNFFSARAKRYSKRFRKKGLSKEQQHLVSGIVETASREKKSEPGTVLEIGCGIAGLLITLLRQGAVHATGIDASQGMIERAKENAAGSGLNEKMEFFHGDFVAIENSISPAEVVILDRVLCCDGNPEMLIRQSASKATRVYAVSFPRDFLPVRLFVKTGIAIAKFFPFRFTPFYHEPALLCRWIEEQGFAAHFSRHTFLWQVLVYRRINAD